MSQPSLFGPEPMSWEEADRADVLCARVAFNLPLDTTFDYLVPDSLRGKLQAGQRVRVPFGRGNRLITAYCVELGPPTHTEGLKRLAGLVDREPLLSAKMLELTRWIAQRYLCSWGQVLECVIPAGVKKRAGTKDVLMVRLVEAALVQDPPLKLSKGQAAVVGAMRAAGKPLRVDQLREQAGCGVGPIQTLRRKRVLEAFLERSIPEKPKDLPTEKPPDLTLNADQQAVLDRLLTALRNKEHRTFLLAGVTGSGKTEVYIRAIQEVVSYGRQAIVLVPEISLTPQTIRRFRSRFPDVSVLHSHLSDVERHQHWRQIASGQVQVVVGARSAVFAPTPHLGLIVIDEEHENSFKQDLTPRYHAREVARKRAELDGVPLILGSATPSLESWVRGVAGHDEILRLPKRVEGLPLPPVRIIDARDDAQLLGGASIGRAMQQAIQQTLTTGGQVILFLNLRGYSPIVWCRACGNRLRCPNCDVTLTWHKEQERLLCHSCEHRAKPPPVCPTCQKPGLRYFGTGTQRLEQEVRARFPGVKCLRMDSDSMNRPGSHDQALEAFRKGEVRILLGTQMITKGLDFPNVTLVGVVDADTMLHQPDFRAAERTFQLIAQVAGRTGRSVRGGRVLVQTASPTARAIECAAKHDFLGFAQAELLVRKEMEYPPFTHQVRVIVRGEDERQVHDAAAAIAALCESQIELQKLPIKVLGPAPAPVARLKSNYRYHLLLSSAELPHIQQLWKAVAPAIRLPKDVEHTVDVDPLNLR